MGVKISEMTAATIFQDDDVLAIAQDSSSKKITKALLRSLLFSDPDEVQAYPQAGDSITFDGSDWVPGARGGWRTIHQDAYTESSPASTSTIAFNGSAQTNGILLKASDYFAVGSPVRVEIGASTYYYGICTAVSDTLLTISGMILPLTTIISLAVGTKEMIKHVDLQYPTTTYNTLGAAVPLAFGCVHQWRGATGYLVAASASHTGTSSTTVVNFKMNAGTNVLTSGITVGAGGASTRGTPVDSSLGDIIAANAVIADKQAITVVVPTAGGTANYLIANLTFIVP